MINKRNINNSDIQDLINKAQSYNIGEINIHSSPWKDGWFVENQTAYMADGVSTTSAIINTFTVFDSSLEVALTKFIEKLEELKKYYYEIDKFNKTIDTSLFTKCKLCNNKPDIIRISYERFFDKNNNEMFIGEVICSSHIARITTAKFYDKDSVVKDMVEKWNEYNK